MEIQSSNEIPKAEANPEENLLDGQDGLVASDHDGLEPIGSIILRATRHLNFPK